MSNGHAQLLLELEVEEYSPDPKVFGVASRRTGPIVAGYALRSWDFYQATKLAQACYLQGVEDTVRALADKIADQIAGPAPAYNHPEGQ